MNDDDSRRDTDSDEPKSRSKAKDPSDSTSGERREPIFTDFDEDEDFDAADRDTAYASAYEEESEDDEYLEPLEDEDPDDISSEWQVLGAAGAGATAKSDKNPWDAVEKTHSPADNKDSDDDDYDTETVRYDSELDDDELEDDFEEYEPEPEYREQEATDTERPDERWDASDDYPDELEILEDEPVQEGAHSWPLGLVIVGIVALVLLAAGGYGVIQQRSATQEEIRQLQATLATAASPADVAASREALRDAEQRKESLAASVDRLTLENRRLSDTVTALEEQLATQQAALAEAAAPKPAAPPKPAVKAKPETSVAGSGGDWFVNFSSYGQRSVAESWAKKLKPSAGQAVVATSTRDGKTFYRVRIVGLPDKAAARTVAGQLESAYKLPPLWVGSE